MILDFDILSWFLGILTLAIVLLVLRRRGASLPYLFFFSFFWIYLLVVIKTTVYPIPLARGVSEESPQALLPLMLGQIHLRPFFFGPWATPASITTTVLQNLVLTLPFGFGINFVRRLGLKDILWLAVLVGFGIEVVQFLLALLAVFFGIWSPVHIVDINDALLNLIGVLLGYGLFRLFAEWYGSIQDRFKTNPFFAYVQDVTR